METALWLPNYSAKRPRQCTKDVWLKHDRAKLLGPALLEKLAREKYLMKRPGEDVFVLVPKEEEK